jgi:ribosome-associated protein
MNTSPLPPLELVKLCARALDEKKAENLRVLDVSEQSSITDYLVLATGNSEPHLRALRVELEKAIDAAGTHIVGMDIAQESGWLVVDAFDVMVHIFTAENRKKYRLENLWKDAVEISVPGLLARPVAKKKTTVRKKTAVKKTAKKPPAKKKAVKPRAKKA